MCIKYITTSTKLGKVQSLDGAPQHKYIYIHMKSWGCPPIQIHIGICIKYITTKIQNLARYKVLMMFSSPRAHARWRQVCPSALLKKIFHLKITKNKLIHQVGLGEKILHVSRCRKVFSQIQHQGQSYSAHYLSSRSNWRTLHKADW